MNRLVVSAFCAGLLLLLGSMGANDAEGVAQPSRAIYAHNDGGQAAFRFASWSDIQDQGSHSPTTAAKISALNPAFSILNGDFSDDGVILDPANHDSMQWMAVAMGNNLFGETFLHRGNHDNHYSNPADWQLFFSSYPEGLGTMADRVTRIGGRNYSYMTGQQDLTYSFDFDNARFIMVDDPGSISSVTAAQVTWLDQRLSEAESNHPELVHAFISFHGPLYCVTYHCSCPAQRAGCQGSIGNSLIDVINRHPIVTATFNGHEHNLGWTHLDSTRISTLTHPVEQFMTAPGGQPTYNQYVQFDGSGVPYRFDYVETSIEDQAFGIVDVNGLSYTVSLYRESISAPVWSHTFTKSGPSLTSTPAASATMVSPTRTASRTPTSVPTPPAGTSSPTTTPVSGAAPIVWAQDAMTWIYKHDPIQSNPSVTLYSARREYEPFQIVVRAPATNNLGNVNVLVSDLIGPGNATISSQNINLYREYYVSLPYGSDPSPGTNTPLGPGLYPDGLIPFTDPDTHQDLTGGIYDAAPFSVPAGENQPIFVDIYIPPTVPAGQYHGTATITGATGTNTIDIVLNVWDFTLPLVKALHAYSLTDPDLRDNLANYKELLRHGLNPKYVDIADEQYLMDNFGLDRVTAYSWSGSSLRHCYTNNPVPDPADVAAEAARHRPGLYLYDEYANEIWACTDNISSGFYLQWANALRAGGVHPHLVTYPVATPSPGLLGTPPNYADSAGDEWSVLPKHYDQARTNIDLLLTRGVEMWSYNPLNQEGYSPKFTIDYLPINSRIMQGFINQSIGFSGSKFWRVDYWTGDPWNVKNRYDQETGSQSPGEGDMTYRGLEAGLPADQIIAGMRLKWFREGAEDYEYVQILKNMGQGEFAMDTVHIVATDFHIWSQDKDALYRARQALGDRIDALNRGTATPSPTTISSRTAIPSRTAATSPTVSPSRTATPSRTTAAYPTAAPSRTTSPWPTPTICPIHFSDVPTNSPFDTYVRCLACRHIFSGYPDGSFGPNDPVTRGQLSKIVSNAAGYSEAFSNNSFEDVPVGSTFFLYAERLYLHGAIQGYACGGAGEPCVPPGNKPYFQPNANVTRGQTSKIVAIARQLPTPNPGQQTFEDVPEGSAFWTWIEALASTGAIQGYACGGVGEPCMPTTNPPYFRSRANVSRGQGAKIVGNAFFRGCVP